jgi:hypothetical protein
VLASVEAMMECQGILDDEGVTEVSSEENACNQSNWFLLHSLMSATLIAPSTQLRLTIHMVSPQPSQSNNIESYGGVEETYGTEATESI